MSSKQGAQIHPHEFIGSLSDHDPEHQPTPITITMCELNGDFALQLSAAL